MFYLINRTLRSANKKATSNMKLKEKKWPTIEELGDFVKPGDTLEIIEIESSFKVYHGVNYLIQSPASKGTERINATGTGYVTAMQKAKDWLSEKVKPTGLVLPHPKCRKGCRAEEMQDVQSIADTGLCWECRTPKRNVVVPKPKKIKRFISGF